MRAKEKERAENQSNLDQEFPRGTIKTDRSINYRLRPLSSRSSEIYRQKACDDIDYTDEELPD
jgi:hypothetical protein